MRVISSCRWCDSKKCDKRSVSSKGKCGSMKLPRPHEHTSDGRLGELGDNRAHKQKPITLAAANFCFLTTVAAAAAVASSSAQQRRPRIDALHKVPHPGLHFIESVRANREVHATTGQGQMAEESSSADTPSGRI